MRSFQHKQTGIGKDAIMSEVSYTGPVVIHITEIYMYI